MACLLVDRAVGASNANGCLRCGLDSRRGVIKPRTSALSHASSLTAHDSAQAAANGGAYRGESADQRPCAGSDCLPCRHASLLVKQRFVPCSLRSGSSGLLKRRNEALLDQQRGMATGQAVGAGAGALIGAFTPVGPAIGSSLGAVVGGQAARVAQGRGPGFDDTASGVQAATQTAIGVAGANRAINQQAGQDRYGQLLSDIVSDPEMIQAYNAMPGGLAKQVEAGDVDKFSGWYKSGAWRGLR